MTTIKELKQLDLDRVGSEPLKEQIDKLLTDYNNETDKDFFTKVNQSFIDKFYELTAKNFPEALPGGEKEPGAKKQPQAQDKPGESSKTPQAGPDTGLKQKITRAVEQLDEVRAGYDGDDLEGILYNTREGLASALEHHGSDSSLRKAVGEVIGVAQAFEETIEQNQRLRHGEVIESDKPARKALIKVIGELKKGLGSPEKEPKGPIKHKEASKPDKAVSEAIVKELKALEPELEACRATIREYNRRKKEAEGPKPQKTRYTRLKEKLLALISLMPDKLREDPDAQRKTEKILLTVHRELVMAWGMNKVKAKPGEEAIKDRFEALAEKGKKD